MTLQKFLDVWQTLLRVFASNEAATMRHISDAIRSCADVDMKVGIQGGRKISKMGADNDQ
jgi:hypothetical protein